MLCSSSSSIRIYPVIAVELYALPGPQKIFFFFFFFLGDFPNSFDLGGQPLDIRQQRWHRYGLGALFIVHGKE